MDASNNSQSATPLNDGVPNILKYLFDIDPAVSMNASDREALPKVGMDITSTPGTTYLTLTFGQSQAATGLSVTVQTSSDLQNWTNPSLTTGVPANMTQYREQLTGEKDPKGDPYLEIEVPVPVNVSREFIRLSVPTQ